MMALFFDEKLTQITTHNSMCGRSKHELIGKCYFHMLFAFAQRPRNELEGPSKNCVFLLSSHQIKCTYNKF